MYPGKELTRLAAHKASLRPGIAQRRIQTAASAARVLRPVAWLERARLFWRRFGPITRLAAMPLIFALKRAWFGSR